MNPVQKYNLLSKIEMVWFAVIFISLIIYVKDPRWEILIPFIALILLSRVIWEYLNNKDGFDDELSALHDGYIFGVIFILCGAMYSIISFKMSMFLTVILSLIGIILGIMTIYYTKQTRDKFFKRGEEIPKINLYTFEVKCLLVIIAISILLLLAIWLLPVEDFIKSLKNL